MPIDLLNNTEMRNDLLDYPEDILGQFNLLKTEFDAEKSVSEVKVVDKIGNAKKGKRKSRLSENDKVVGEDSVALYMGISYADMQKARLVAIVKNCSVSSLFSSCIKDHIESLFQENRDEIMKMLKM